MKNVLRKIFINKATKKVVHVLDEFSYFLPDVFLVLMIFALLSKDMGKYHYIITGLLFITYLATSYGEYMYSRLKYARYITDDIIKKQLDNFESQINDKKFVTLDGLLMFSDIVENEMDKKVDVLRREIKGDVNHEMDSQETIQEIQK